MADNTSDNMAATDPMGGCQCGNIRYRYDGVPLELTICHCADCQRQTGSAFGMSLTISASAFRLLSGELKVFEVISDSGRIKSCAFCPDCGTRIYHRSDDMISIKAGTLNDTASLRPTYHYWTQSKQPWVPIPDDAISVPDDG